jgi:D-3-phosphoglycerate dehydrogenase
MHFSSLELTDRTLGIIGLGRIGSRMAKKAALGLGMAVLAYDPYIDRASYNGPAVFVDALEDLLARADAITLHVPLTDTTRGMINAERLAQMKKGAYLINTARGAAVDETALAAALQAGHLAGAAIDVFAQEPPDLTHPLQNAPNALLTPHVAGLSDRALVQVATQAAQGIIDVLQDRRPQSPVNPSVFY